MEKKLNFLQFKDSLRHKEFNVNESKGRRHKEDEELLLYGSSYDPFQLDIEKIRLSKFYRRLADKTQVFPVSCHGNIRNRLIHTNDVVSISSFAAKLLGLNHNLVEAIAYGHDIGHTPYGHLGERIISKIADRNFSHAVMGVVIAQKVERSGKGLNLSYETLKGILNHSSGGRKIITNNNLIDEENLVMLCDKIAYIFSDINDCYRLNYFNNNNKPPGEIFNYFGKNQRERIARTIYSLIAESSMKGKISFFESKEAIIFSKIRAWMYENVYLKIDKGVERKKREVGIRNIYENISNLSYSNNNNPLLLVSILTDSEADYLSGLSSKTSDGYEEIIEKLGSNCLINIFDPDLNENNFH